MFILALALAALQTVVTAAPVDTNAKGDDTKVVIKPLQLAVNPDDVIEPVSSPLEQKEQTHKEYVEFINELYKNDKSKTPLTLEEKKN